MRGAVVRARGLLERRGAEGAAACKAVYEDVLDAYERECAEREADFSQKIKKEDAPEGDAPAFPRARAPDWVTSAYVEYMRCCRRVEGAASARKAFMRARKAPGLGERPEVYACSAQLEWRYDGNDKPARNVFELGLKKCIGDPAYVETYAEFLVGLNDVANARVLYERATAAALEACAGNQALGANAGVGASRVSSLLRVDPAERARREETLETLFDAFAAFEHHHGSLDAMASVEARRHAALGEVGGGTDAAPAMLTALMRRHAFLGLSPATEAQARHYERLGAAFATSGSGRSGAGRARRAPRRSPRRRPSATQAAAAREGRGAPRCGGGGGGGGGAGYGRSVCPGGAPAPEGAAAGEHPQAHASSAGAGLLNSAAAAAASRARASRRARRVRFAPPRGGRGRRRAAARGGRGDGRARDGGPLPRGRRGGGGGAQRRGGRRRDFRREQTQSGRRSFFRSFFRSRSFFGTAHRGFE